MTGHKGGQHSGSGSPLLSLTGQLSDDVGDLGCIRGECSGLEAEDKLALC